MGDTRISQYITTIPLIRRLQLSDTITGPVDKFSYIHFSEENPVHVQLLCIFTKSECQFLLVHFSGIAKFSPKNWQKVRQRQMDRWANRQTDKHREMQETSDFDIKLIWVLGLSSLIRSHKLSYWCFFTQKNVLELSFMTFISPSSCRLYGMIVLKCTKKLT